MSYIYYYKTELLENTHHIFLRGESTVQAFRNIFYREIILDVTKILSNFSLGRCQSINKKLAKLIISKNLLYQIKSSYGIRL